jgi:methionine biosynthesis protein MetW
MANSNLDPDSSSYHFLGYKPSPLRYEHCDSSKYEVHSIIANMISPHESILEIGSGTGILGEVLRGLGINRYQGIEPSEARAEKATSKGLVVHNIYLDESSILGFGQFDVIILADVLEHLVNPHELLILVRQLMHPASRLIISVPNIAHWSIRLGLLAGKFEYTETGILDSTHIRWFTVNSLKRYLATSGLHTVDERFASGYMLPCYACLRKGV